MTRSMPTVDAVIKMGGALLRQPGTLERVVRAVEDAASRYHLVVVPGGGPFADAVRTIDHDAGLPDDAAHWMAILGMEQCAHLLTTCMEGAQLVERPEEIRGAIEAGHLPVLAPYQWLRSADPLPHVWEVTSDSIAAWVAGELRARMLVLIKPAAALLADLVDPYFPRALPPRVRAVPIAAAAVDELPAVLARNQEPR
ncbi:MAG TPA: hypothetical protein VFW98_00670 [Gemmatimonadaceae bacterium]|nr:hypothetical protein [Gemmatimonadaceae bacterium]